MAADFAQQRGTKGGLFEKEWFRHIEQRQDVLRRTESLWSDRSRPPRKPKALPPAKAWAPGDARTPVIIVTGPIGGGKSSVVRHLAARDALVVTHRYWQDWGTTPPPPRDDGIDRASVFDFGNACVCCAPDGDLQALLKKKKSARSVLIETTGTADPALFARVLHQDAVLRDRYVLRSVVFVADARDVRKQLAAPDSPGAPNPHRLQLLAANHAVLTRGGDVTLPGFAGPVDQGLPGRDALEGFDAAAVVKAFRLGEKPPRYALWFGTFKSATDAHLVPKADSALAHHVATALLRVCCAAGHLAAARGVLKKMCEQEEPKIMPGAALLTTYLLACGRPASVARVPLAALDAFEKLKGFPSLTPEKCGEIWASCLAPTAAAVPSPPLGAAPLARGGGGGGGARALIDDGHGVGAGDDAPEVI